MELTIPVTDEEITRTATANDQHEKLAARLLTCASRAHAHNRPGEPLWNSTQFGNPATGTHGEWLLRPGRLANHQIRMNNLPPQLAERVLSALAETDPFSGNGTPGGHVYQGAAAEHLARAVPGLVPLDSAPVPGSAEGSTQRWYTSRLTPQWCPQATIMIRISGPGADARIAIEALGLTGLQAMLTLLAYDASLPKLP